MSWNAGPLQPKHTLQTPPFPHPPTSEITPHPPCYPTSFATNRSGHGDVVVLDGGPADGTDGPRALHRRELYPDIGVDVRVLYPRGVLHRRAGFIPCCRKGRGPGAAAVIVTTYCHFLFDIVHRLTCRRA